MDVSHCNQSSKPTKEATQLLSTESAPETSSHERSCHRMNGGGNNLNMVLRSMDQMHVDFGLVVETKFNHDKYTRDCCGYTVFATKAKSSSQGGVAFFYRSESDLWSIEGLRSHGPNVISCTIVSGASEPDSA